MRAHQFLPEIERISRSDFAGGKSQLDQNARPKKLRNLPGESGLLYTVDGKQDISIRLWDPSVGPAPANIAKLTLESFPSFPLPGALQVDTINVDEDYRGLGLAKALYGIVLTVLKRPLVSGHAQTPGGRANWVSLSQIPGVEIKGYVILADEDIDQRIDTIMGRLGGQYLGKSRQHTSNHFFAFDVEPATSGKELRAHVKQNLARVYDEGFDFTTGLYAVWTGQQ